MSIFTKKVLSIVLSFVLALSLVPNFARANSVNVGSDNVNSEHAFKDSGSDDNVSASNVSAENKSFPNIGKMLISLFNPGDLVDTANTKDCAYYVNKDISGYESGTLYFYGQENKDLEGKDGVIKYEWANTSSTIEESPFNDAKNCNKVVFDESALNIKPESCHAWFMGFEKCVEFVDPKYLDTSNVKDMAYMFAGVSYKTAETLPILNLSSWNTSNVKDMSYMFSGFANGFADKYKFDYSAIVFVTNKFTVGTDTKTDQMFLDSQIEGGAGTSYRLEYVDGKGACIDNFGGSDWGVNKGYFTDGSLIGKEYNISFNCVDPDEKCQPLGVSVTDPPVDIKVEYGKSLPVIKTIPKCEGLEFVDFHYKGNMDGCGVNIPYYEEREGMVQPVENIIWTIPSDVTLYAKWNYFIETNFHTNYIECSESYMEYFSDIEDYDPLANGESLRVQLPTETDFDYPGYKFGGWYTKYKNGIYSDGPITSYDRKDRDPMDFYLKWIPEKYEITFSQGDLIDGETVEELQTNIVVEYNSTPLTSVKTPECDGYEFDGFYYQETPDDLTDKQKIKTIKARQDELAGNPSDETSEDQEAESPKEIKFYDEQGNLVDNRVWNYLHDVNLVAHWKPIEYDVTLNTNDGIIADGCNVASYAHGNKVELPDNGKITKPGFGFMGWYDNVELKGEPVSMILATDTGNKVFWAKWQGNVTNVTLNKNGGKFGNVAYNITSYVSGTETILPNEWQITKPGFAFKGWYDNEELKGDPVSKILATDTGNKVFWAKWDAIDYSFIFNGNPPKKQANVDNIQSNLEKVSFEGNLPKEVLIPTCESYEFAGFYYHLDNKEIPIYDSDGKLIGDEKFLWNITGDSINPKNIINLYAHWDRGKYTIIFNNGNTNDRNPSDMPDDLNNLTFGNGLSKLSKTPKCGGFKFDGFYYLTKDASGNDLAIKIYNADGSVDTKNNIWEIDGIAGVKEITLYAEWTANSNYRIILNNEDNINGHKITASTPSGFNDVIYNSDLSEITTPPTCKNYVFDGFWYGKDKDAIQIYDNKGKPIESVNLWEKVDENSFEINLYSRWHGETCGIEFTSGVDANEQNKVSYIPSKIENIEFGSSLKDVLFDSTSTPKYIGHSLDGFYYNDGEKNEPIYQSNGELNKNVNLWTIANLPDNKVITLKAKWTAEEFDVVVTSNAPEDANVEGMPDTIPVTFGKNLPEGVFKTLPNCPGYKFNGARYVNDKNKDGIPYYDNEGAPIKDAIFDDSTPTDNHGHFVVDFAKLNTVIFEKNSPTGDDKDVTNMPENIEDMDIDSRLPESIFDSKHPKTKCSGYDFEGFEYSKKDMNNKEVTTLIYDDEGKLNKNADIWMIADLTNNTITLKAKWTAEEFDVVVTSNAPEDANVEGMPDTIPVTFGKNLPEGVFKTLPNCPGYKFNGARYVNDKNKDGIPYYDNEGAPIKDAIFDDSTPTDNHGHFVVDFAKLNTVIFEKNSPTGDDKDVTNMPENIEDMDIDSRLPESIFDSKHPKTKCSGYDFEGFEYSKKDMNNKEVTTLIYDDEGKLNKNADIWMIADLTNNTITLKAKWTAEEFDVVVTSNAPEDANVEGMPDTIPVTFGKNLPEGVFKTLPNCPGYKFNGARYVNDKNKDGISYYDNEGAPIKDAIFDDSTPTDNHGHFVVDFAKLNTVIFEKNSPTGDDKDVTNMPENIEDMDIDSRLPESIFDSKHPKTKCSGYDFEGFEYSKKDMNNKEVTTLIYDDEGKLNKNADIWMIADLTNNTITLKAKWTAEEFDVVVTSNAPKDANVEGMPDTIPVTFGKNLPEGVFKTLPNCPGYKFNGARYVNDKNKDGISYYDNEGAPIKDAIFDDSTPTDNHGHFVVDFAKLNTVIFEKNSPTGDDKDVTNMPENIEDMDIDSKLPESIFDSKHPKTKCSGYDFEGFEYSKKDMNNKEVTTLIYDDEGKLNKNADIWMIADLTNNTIALKAKWTAEEFDVVVTSNAPKDANVEGMPDIIPVTFGENLPEGVFKTLPNCPGYKFNGVRYVNDKNKDGIPYYDNEGAPIKDAIFDDSTPTDNHGHFVVDFAKLNTVIFEKNSPTGDDKDVTNMPENIEDMDIDSKLPESIFDSKHPKTKCSGYDFEGFEYSKKDMNNKEVTTLIYDDEGKLNKNADIWMIADLTNNTIALKAKWTAEEFDVVVTSNAPKDANVEGMPDIIPVTFGENLPEGVFKTLPNCPGYKFNGVRYVNDKNKDGIPYYDNEGAPIKDAIFDDSTPTDNHGHFVVDFAKLNTVIFEKNSPTGDDKDVTNMPENIEDMDIDSKLPESIFDSKHPKTKCSGYDFEGFEYSKKDMNNKEVTTLIYDDEGKLNKNADIWMIADLTNNTIALKAKWTAEEFDVGVTSNAPKDANVEGMPDIIPVTFGENLPEGVFKTLPNCPGYKFNGVRYVNDKNKDGIPYYDNEGAPIKDAIFDDSTPTDNHGHFVVDFAKLNTVIFEKNSPTGDDKDVTNMPENIEDMDIDSKLPESIFDSKHPKTKCSGYDFEGFEYSKKDMNNKEVTTLIYDDEGKLNKNADIWMIADLTNNTITLKAKWTAEEFVVGVTSNAPKDANVEGMPDIITVTFGENLPEGVFKTLPNCPGYKFNGVRYVNDKNKDGIPYYDNEGAPIKDAIFDDSTPTDNHGHFVVDFAKLNTVIFEKNSPTGDDKDVTNMPENIEDMDIDSKLPESIFDSKHPKTKCSGYDFEGFEYSKKDMNNKEVTTLIYDDEGKLNKNADIWMIADLTNNTIALKAKWTAEEFDVGVTSNAPKDANVEGMPDIIPVTFGENLPEGVFKTLPNCPGYKFNGVRYVNDKNKDGIPYYDNEGAPIKDAIFDDSTPTDNHGHFVVDFAKLNTVIFEKNSPTGDDKDVTNMPENIEDMDIDSKLPESIFDSKHPKTKCSGYDFEGFEYSKKDMNNKEVTTLIYDDEGKLNKNADIWMIADLTNNTITLKAKWTAEEFVVGVTSNAPKDANVEGMPDIITVTFGENLPEGVFKTLPNCPGYKFNGAHYVKSGNPKDISDNTLCYDKNGKPVNNMKFDDPEGNGKFVVDWKAPSKYSVTLIKNGGTITAGCDVTAYVCGVGANLPNEDQITKPGYTFIGWFENDDFSDNPTNKISEADSDNKVYYAKWQENSDSLKTLNKNKDDEISNVYLLGNEGKNTAGNDKLDDTSSKKTAAESVFPFTGDSSLPFVIGFIILAFLTLVGFLVYKKFRR